MNATIPGIGFLGALRINDASAHTRRRPAA